jgi:hypothetical protein
MSKDGFYESREWRQVRYLAIKANNGLCELCGRGKHDGVVLHVDHIEPRSKAPHLELDPDNLQVLCEDCNLGKGNRDAVDWRVSTPIHEESFAGYSSLVLTAIALLLHQPGIARLASTDSLECVIGDDAQLLRELLRLLQRRPDSSTAMLLGHWYGTEEGKLLSRLAGQERLIPTTGIEQQFIDTMAALAHLPHESKLVAQVDKLKRTNYADLDENEMSRLRDLLQTKLVRDQAKGRGAYRG